MDYDLNDFGLDEPLLDEMNQQPYSGFMLDQPLDLFDDLSESQESSLGSTGQAVVTDSLHDSPQDSLSSSSFSNYNSQQQPRRDSSDESDVGIVDDIVIPPILIGTKRTANGSSIVSSASSTKTATVQGINFPPNAFISTQNSTRQVAASVTSRPTIIKVEPMQLSQPPTPALSYVEDKKPNIAPKPCLVISSNGSLTAVPLSHCMTTTGKVLNLKDLQPASNGNMSAAAIEHQEEMERAAKRQMRILKNREAATMSRLRQKQYLESLEERVKLLAQENEKVKRENEEMRQLVGRLHEENVGLRNNNVAGVISTKTSSSSSSDCIQFQESNDDVPQQVVAPSPAIVITSMQQPAVIDLDDEPAPKKILVKPVNSISRVSVPVMALPVTSSPAKQTIPIATISRDSRGISVHPKTEQQQLTIRRQSITVGPSVYTLTRQPRTLVLVFSIIFAFNCIPFASRLFRESSTNMSPLAISGVEEFSLNGNDLPLTPPVAHSNSRTLDGGRMLYPAAPHLMKKRAVASSSGNDLMVLPRQSPDRHRMSYYEDDIDNNDLPLMDDSLLDEDESANQLAKCPTSSPVNASHSQRIVNVLSQWASLQQQQPVKRRNKAGQQTVPFDLPRVVQNFDEQKLIGPSNYRSSDLQPYRRRAVASNRHLSRPSSSNNVEPSEASDGSLAQYEKFAKTIQQRNDTFYMVSFHVDQLIFPALVVNRTSRPKMSLILPALFSLNETVSPPEGSVALMQIECEITDMKIMHLSKHLVPLDIVLRHMREDGAQASGTSRMYRQWLYGKTASP